MVRERGPTHTPPHPIPTPPQVSLLEKQGVEFRTSTEVGEESMELMMDFDAVVLATGSTVRGNGQGRWWGAEPQLLTPVVLTLAAGAERSPNSRTAAEWDHLRDGLSHEKSKAALFRPLSQRIHFDLQV